MTVAYRNTKTGRVVRLADPLPSMDRSKRWQRIDADEPARDQGDAPKPPWEEPAPADPGGPFDPTGHTVAQVNEHLAGAALPERERVLQAEAEGRGRRGILQGPHSDLTGA